MTTVRIAASLAAAISLLERSPKTGAPSDTMFDMMVADYKKALQEWRVAEANCGATCEWWNDGEMWESPCGVAYMFNSDGPEDNGHRFCHKCGKPIAIGETPK